MSVMKVYGKQSVAIEIDEATQKAITTATVKRIAGLSDQRDDYHYVNDAGELVRVTEVHNGRHTDEERTVLRPASDLEKAALLVLKEMAR